MLLLLLMLQPQRSAVLAADSWATLCKYVSRASPRASLLKLQVKQMNSSVIDLVSTKLNMCVRVRAVQYVRWVEGGRMHLN